MVSNNRRFLMHLMPFEAFRCLIDEDAQGGKRIAAAMATLVGRFNRDLPKFTGTDDWQRVYLTVSSDSIGLTYDWAYPFMDDAQRNTVRKFIGDITNAKNYLGLDQLPAIPGNTSNWITVHANLLSMILAIEGEDGYDPLVYQRLVEGLRKWCYVGAWADGAPFEGLTKSSYAPQWLIPLAKRGEPFIGTEWAKNHVRKYHLHMMVPWGGRYVFESGINPPRDISPWKFSHPADPIVDIVYADQVKSMFADNVEPQWPIHRTTYAPWFPYLVFADDPMGATGATYDYDKAFDKVMADLAKTEPVTYWSDFYGCLSTRTAWQRDAHHLYFEIRSMPGGHSRDDRNEFVYSALGKVWANRTFTNSEAGSDVASIILIDGKGQGHQCPPGKALAFVDTRQATFAAADAVWAYSHALSNIKKATPIPITPNDSRITPGKLPWMNQPWSFMPAWSTGMKGADRHGNWIDYNPVQYAYRTAGLVRGAHPYVLITDDLRKDNAEHDYLWLMQITDDLEIISRTPGQSADQQTLDLVLGAKGDNRRLLVRILQAGDTDAQKSACITGARIDVFDQPGPRQTSKSFKRLILPLKATTATYKILLHAYQEGQPLPKTT